MNVEQSEADGVTLLVPSGHLDTSTSGVLKNGAAPIVAAPGCRVVLDMGQVVYVSSAGLRVILNLAKQARSQDGDLVICALTPRVREVFDISGFSRLITLCDSRTEALAALHRTKAGGERI